MMTGGPAPGITQMVPGTVVARGELRTKTEASERGRFDLAVTAGVYVLTGTSPYYGNGRYRCEAAKSVPVVAGQVTEADVYCHRK